MPSPSPFAISIFHSTKFFSNVSALCIKWPKDRSFSSRHSNEYSELISFRIDWFYLLSIQGTLKSLPQHNNSQPLILQHSAEELWSNSHIHTWLLEKSIALTRHTFSVKLDYYSKHLCIYDLECDRCYFATLKSYF